eukprot:CAMPEP_0201877088 /NCGR_PEP_ID=MMETSP0902-20130614/8590_1 /ASSEMBLY_ACC=CAM_ASM_000551 /TAXON_ID=420261 /ORGANISM="Thalassiosira antarctica, Strain CCMP982" /LENGTH=50 /DNA_ID=CAMNT_0048404463 /DNA_START=8 /DNA_END=160 /DNA_ORIENTATION=+
MSLAHEEATSAEEASQKAEKTKKRVTPPLPRSLLWTYRYQRLTSLEAWVH